MADTENPGFIVRSTSRVDDDEHSCNLCLEICHFPIVLDCSHIFCKQCVEKMTTPQSDKIACAICKCCSILTPIASSSLERVPGVVSDAGAKCSLCDDAVGVLTCEKCNFKLFCEKCSAELHKFKTMSNHQPVKANSVGMHDVPYCEQHPDTPCLIFCPKCDILVCHQCALIDHSPASGHAIISCNTAALLAHSDVCSRLVPLKAKLENYKKSVHQVDAAILKQSETSQRVDPEITTKISNLFTLFGQNGSNGIASIMERFTLRRKYATDVRSTMMTDIAKMNRIVLHAEINTVVTDANPHAPPRTGLTALMHLMTLRDTQAGFRSINDELALEEHLAWRDLKTLSFSEAADMDACCEAAVAAVRLVMSKWLVIEQPVFGFPSIPQTVSVSSNSSGAGFNLCDESKSASLSASSCDLVVAAGQTYMLAEGNHMFNNVTINENGIITTAGWNSVTRVGGYLQLRCETLVNNGVIDMSGKGYHGGVGPSNSFADGFGNAGESYGGAFGGHQDGEANIGGGGGGQKIAGFGAGGGGGAGFGSPGQTVKQKNIHSGKRGGTYGSEDMIKGMLGSGGGSGNGIGNDTAPHGGAGGGAIYITCKHLFNSGKICAKGLAGGAMSISAAVKTGCSCSGGGGGSGGSILIEITSNDDVSEILRGGLGGVICVDGGLGGQGSGVRVRAAHLSGTFLRGGSGGDGRILVVSNP